MTGKGFTCRPAGLNEGETIHKLRETFQTVWSDYPQRVGETFTVVAMQWDTGEFTGLNPEPMFHIRFADGETIVARAEEIFEDWIEAAPESWIQPVTS